MNESMNELINQVFLELLIRQQQQQQAWIKLTKELFCTRAYGAIAPESLGCASHSYYYQEKVLQTN